MKKASIGIIVGSLMVTGCAGMGSTVMRDKTEASVQGEIVKGQTTQQQIRTSYGSPFETTFTNDGHPIYRYYYDDVSFLTPETVLSTVFTLGLAGSVAEGERKELTIIFDENNLVKNYSVSQSDIRTGTGAFK